MKTCDGRLRLPIEDEIASHSVENCRLNLTAIEPGYDRAFANRLTNLTSFPISL